MALLMLLDGNSLTYRAFFALPTDLATASGQVTNAVYGFTSMLVNLIKDHKPDYLAVAFDRPEQMCIRDRPSATPMPWREHGTGWLHRSSVWSTSSTSSWTSWYPGTPVSSHYRGSQ